MICYYETDLCKNHVHCLTCPNYVIPKTITNACKTNADHIRSMNDQELTKFLMSNWFTDDVCNHCEGRYDQCGDLNFCASKLNAWLTQERLQNDV